MSFSRIQTLPKAKNRSCFLWGPRQVGKSTLLKQLYPQAPRYNLLDPALFADLSLNPALLKEKILAQTQNSHPIIIDEVQKIPQLLDVVQLLIDDHNCRFVLSGSSARKLKRGGANLLAGRALRYELYPFVSQEIPDFNLLRALNHGLLPDHYLTDHPKDLIHAYVGNYLKEEIVAEALTRNLQAFSRFLEAAAFSNGEMVNFTNVAQDCGVKSTTIREYFQILEDTLIGRFVPSYQKRAKRRVIKAPKFYYFDLGIVNFLLKRNQIQPGSEIFGRVFEHFIFQELCAHSHYSGSNHEIAYWRTTADVEVDFILGQAHTIVEVKGKKNVLPKDLKGLHQFREEHTVKNAIVVSLEEAPRLADGILILPWQEFLTRLWSGKIIS